MSKQPSDFFIFNFEAPDSGSSPEDVVAFTPAKDVDGALLAEALRRHLERESPPGRLFILGPHSAADRLREVAESEDLADALPPFTRWVDPPPVVALAFDEHGSLVDLDGRASETESEEFSATLLRAGLRSIFNAHTGMLRAPSGFHYVNPSGRHTLAFIRTGNVLLHSAEVSFIAMGLLRWWPPGLKRIFVDTASISSVAYALIDLRRAFEPDLIAPTIDSFSSYEGVGAFGFEPRDALCLISASTSGGLEREIIEARYLPAERIVTLFYCGAPLSNSRILCDLTARDGMSGDEPIRSFRREQDCEMCRRGSAIVHISGDQFLPADPEVSDRLLTASSAPSWLGEFQERILGQGIVRCHGGSPGRLREIYLDLEHALTSEGKFGHALKRRLEMALPASLSTILHIGDPSSRVLAEAVRDQFVASSGRDLRPGSFLDIQTVYEEQREVDAGDGAVAVVAGAVSSGRALLGASQYLRNVAEATSIVYIVGVARSPSLADWNRIESSLTWGEHRRDYPLVAVTQAFLPNDRGAQGTPWEVERTFLQHVRDYLIDSEVDDEPALSEIEARRRLIEEAGGSDAGGLRDDVFLPAVKDGTLSFDNPERLLLAPGFVFWPRISEQQLAAASQAEVYLSVLAILHSLRSRNVEGGALVQHEHNRTVLSPANFARFNDAVVQAALLRAALPRELDYSHDKTLSGQMRLILTRFFEHMTGSEGKAAPEFVLALARRQIQLHDEDMRALQVTLGELELPPLVRALRAWMERHHRSESEAAVAAASTEPA